MLYYQHPSKKYNDLSRGTVKALLIIALGSYLAGCLWLLNVPTEGFTWPEAVGYILIFSSLLASGFLVTSSFQHIAADEGSSLDERELALQSRANTFAFRALSVLVLVAIAYCGIAADVDLWMPHKYDHFNALFWGSFLLCTLLPTLYIAYAENDVPEDDE